MYVQQIVLEGFKTYMNRTVISGFDPQFNAITGLNGSGKSNILDAIQFLLGSTSKDLLRLKSGLTELIYKQGFAGIEKAAVTIKFKCNDPYLRPIGYQNYQQLVITRQITRDKVTKFFVNGVSSNLTKVKNLFRSIQLNIQNPHFLVKQGQITKIISLKPLELLSMIQQTAGTSYYSKIKQQSAKLIQKKQQKLETINDILLNTIQPQMQKLNKDRKNYENYQKQERQRKFLSQKIKIYEYCREKNRFQQKNMEFLEVSNDIDIKNNELITNTDKLKELGLQIKLLKNNIPNDKANQYKKMKHLLLQKQNEKKNIQHRYQDIQQQALQNKQLIEKYHKFINVNRKNIQWQQKVVLQTSKHKQDVEGLLSDLQSQKQDLPGLIKKQIKQQQYQYDGIEAECKLMTSKIDIVKIQIQNANTQKNQTNQNTKQLTQMMKRLNQDIQQLSKIKKPIFVVDPEKNNTLLNHLINQRSQLMHNHHQLNLHYSLPSANFDKSSIKGKLFMLFSVIDHKHNKALQIGAGGKLYNIVVQNENISRILIEKGCFGNSVTIMPNNKISYKSMRAENVEQARRIALQMNGFAQPAFQLVKFNKEVQNSIMFAFSNFIVCSSIQIAHRVAYNPKKNLSCKCVTYDGDVYEHGTLTGGHTNPESMIISKYAKLRDIQKKIFEEQLQIEQKKKLFQQYQRVNSQYCLKNQELQMKTEKKEKIKLKLNNISSIIDKRDYIAQLKDMEFKMSILNEKKQKHKIKIKEFKNALNKGNLKSVSQTRNQLENQMKQHIKNLSNVRKKIANLEVQSQQAQKKIEFSSIEADYFLKDLTNLEKQEKQILIDVKEYKIQLERVQNEKCRQIQNNLINEQNLNILSQQQGQLKIYKQNLQEQISDKGLRLETVKNQRQQQQKIVSTFIKENSWLDKSKQYEYDKNFKYKEAIEQQKKMMLEVDKLRKSTKVNIDSKIVTNLQQQYDNLTEKRLTLQKDKMTLLTNMHDLDDKRCQTLQKCFQSVRTGLSNIFNDLLPGATAHLSLIDKKDVTNGIELHVYFNNVQKELSQLSGGQRSLLALSFILALLLYKPSPFYILDEIDSALDLSHTQNIGQMLSQRFPQSQFLLISLKEGMYQNANTLFKVHFTEGESKIQRQVLKKK